MIPILVQVFTRRDHFIRCIESLKAAKGHENHPLIVLSDQGRNDDEKRVVSEIRDYVSHLEGFSSVVRLYADQNLGSYASVMKGFDYAFRKYGQLIYLEDDLVVAPGFLEFMSEAMSRYRGDPRCFSVSGFTYRSFERASRTNHLQTGFCAWGVGIWKEKWQSVDPELVQVYPRRFLDVVRVTLSYPHLYDMARAIRLGRLRAPDCAVHLNLIQRSWYSIHPDRTLVNNLGFDGTGEHCLNPFDNQSPLSLEETAPIARVSPVSSWTTFQTFGGFRQAFWSFEKYLLDRFQRAWK